MFCTRKMSLFVQYILMPHRFVSIPKHLRKCCGATQHNNQLGATGRQTDLKQRALAQQARTPSCGGHGVSHARLPGRPLGPRRDLLTAHLLRAFRADGRTRGNIIVPRGQAGDLRVGGLHGSLPLAARNDDDEEEDDRHATVTDRQTWPPAPSPHRWR